MIRNTTVAFVSLIVGTVGAQATAGKYLSEINATYKPIQENYMRYASTVARGKSARKVENKRKELIRSVNSAVSKVKAMKPFEGDKSYRDSSVSFLTMMHTILTEDYEKIINLEEVAEQSYDAMEAYYLAQDKANEKLDVSEGHLDTTFYRFAAKHHVLIERNGAMNDLSQKVLKASEAMGYQRKIYLMFFKPYKQELYMLDAMNKKNLGAIEQNRTSLLALADEADAKLDTTKPFKNDKSMIQVTKELQAFYKDECNVKMSVITGFLMKEENFAKAKKAYEAKKQSERTQEDVDAYNKAVNEYNAGINAYNNTNQGLNKRRSELIEKWNSTSQRFLDAHVPMY